MYGFFNNKKCVCCALAVAHQKMDMQYFNKQHA